MTSQPAVRLLTVAAALALLGGCSGGNFDLARPAEGEDAIDAGDVSEVSLAEVEVGSSETANSDASISEEDAGGDVGAITDSGAVSSDAGPSDAGGPDMGASDAGSDTGASDAGVDTGASDTGGPAEYTVVVPLDTDTRIYAGGFCSVDDRITASRPYPLGMKASRLVGTLEVESNLGTYGEVTVSVYLNAVYSGAFKFAAATGNSIPIDLSVPASALPVTASGVLITYKVTAETIVSGCVTPKLGVSKLTFKR